MNEDVDVLKAALVDSRAEYLHTLDENPECSAWNLNELSLEEQRVYRRQAVESLEFEEPLMMLQLEEQNAYIRVLEDLVFDNIVREKIQDGCCRQVAEKIALEFMNKIKELR